MFGENTITIKFDDEGALNLIIGELWGRKQLGNIFATGNFIGIGSVV